MDIAARNCAIIEARKRGETLQAIGDRFCMTRERIRQIVLLKASLSDMEEVYLVKARAIIAARERRACSYAAKKQARLDALPNCRICGGRPKTLRGKVRTGVVSRTCSPACSRVWTRNRLNYSADLRIRQRLCMAKGILRVPAKHSPSRVRWAKKAVKCGGQYLTDKVGGFGGRKYHAEEA